jgi:RimJ/RimL family protein N-acetyltransferase
VKKIVINCEDQMAPFMDHMCDSHGAFVAGRCVGLIEVAPEDPDRGEIIACVWYEGYNGANMNMHVAAKPGARWMTREFLWYVFHYPFIECGVKRVTGLVPEMNYAARRFDEHIGFKLEATLKDAAPGGDLRIYTMFKDECRWLKPPRGVVVTPPKRMVN